MRSVARVFTRWFAFGALLIVLFAPTHAHANEPYGPVSCRPARKRPARWRAQKRSTHPKKQRAPNAQGVAPEPTVEETPLELDDAEPMVKTEPVVEAPPAAPAPVAVPNPKINAAAGAPDALPPRPTLWVLVAPKPPKIDGLIEKDVWSHAQPVAAFTQKAPMSGGPASEKTLLRVLSDDDAVYIAFDCEQKSSPILARLARRDRPTESDAVTVAFDSRGDGRSAFELTVTAAGVQVDGVRFDDGKIAREWDGVWEAHSQVRDDGWSAELRIPLHVLRASSAPSGVWKFQARRYVAARQETDEWAFIPRALGGEVSNYGRIEGLRRTGARSAFELQPFIVGRARHQSPDPNLVHSGWQLEPSGGVDFAWHFAASGSLVGSINPDFGQVEADRLILNLTTTELLFPEKRPFFLAGMEDFVTTAPIFYSRRVGRAPRVPRPSSNPAERERPYDVARPSPIYAALKLRADLGRNLTVAALSAVTGPNQLDVRTAMAGRATRLLEPLSSFHVLRIHRRVTPRFDLGLMTTATVRNEPGFGLPEPITSGASYAPVRDAQGALTGGQRCPLGEQTARNRRCFHDAYVASADLMWRSPSGDYALRGQGYGTAIVNGPTRTLPDGTRVGSGDLDGGGVLRISKQGGRHWLWDGTLGAHGRKLDFNDLGYMERQNYVRSGAYVEYRTLEPWRAIFETRSSLLVYGVRNLDGLWLGRGLMLSESVVLRSAWTLTLGGYGTLPRFDDREVGDGTALERAALLGLMEAVTTDARRSFYVWSQASQERLKNALNLDAQLGLSWHPIPSAELSLLGAYTLNMGEPRYAGVGLSTEQLMFGRLDAQSVSVTLRGAITFLPTLTLQAYAQAFLARGSYYEYSQLLRSSATPVVRLSALQRAPAPDTRPDFESGSLAINVVLRWEFRLGSTLYLAYVRGQNGTGAFDPVRGPRFNASFVRDAPATDLLMLKLAYWFG